jgi:hypothetical protein
MRKKTAVSLETAVFFCAPTPISPAEKSMTAAKTS